ncbi:MAG: hydroxyacylglutathione hydrolase, partial [Chlorobi bacterium]|nr:hydroxyacylglutathione hydrolase [Chlorobiota bacterium]
MIEIYQISALSDNYIYLIHDPLSAVTAAIDPAESEPVL